MKKFTPEHKKIFDKAYSSLDFPLAEHSFQWVYIWESCYKDIEWAEINGNLCLFLTFEGARCVWGPVLPGKKLEDTMRKCFSLCDSYNASRGKKTSATYIPEELKEEYSAIEGFELKEQNKDYIYKVKDIIELGGRGYKDKRNKRNFFIKNHKYSAEGYSAAKHRQGCEELLERWKKQKLPSLNKEDLEKVEEEARINRRAFELAEALGIKGMVVLVDERIEGYIFGERTNNRICTMFFGKSNLEIKGLSQFIYGEFLKRNFSDAELVNDGEDWDVGYLELGKLSYNPERIRKSYTLVKSK